MLKGPYIPTEDPLYQQLLPVQNLHPIAKEVIKTSPFQRLFGIYHGGAKGDPNRNHQWQQKTHNRGTHSVSAGLLAQHLGKTETLKDIDLEHLTLAALLHDLGHTAFSHLGEMATGECHKDTTQDLIHHHEELHLIWQKHSIDPNIISSAALEKTPGNPITVPRGQGLISVDHLNNTLLDLHTRLNDPRAQKLAQELLQQTFLKDGIIYLKRPARFLQTEFIQASIRQNLGLIFNKKDLLLDEIGVDTIQKLIQAGVLSPKDFHLTQPEVIAKMTSPEAYDIAQTELEFLFRKGPALTQEEVNKRVRKLGINEKTPPNGQTREITSTYLMTIPIEEDQIKPPNGELEHISKAIKGKWHFDLNGLFKASHSTEQAA